MVWGANGGIGRATVDTLVGAGWTVVAAVRQAGDLALLTPHIIEADVTAPYAVEVAIHCAAQMVDAVNFWIYSVGDIATAKVADLAPASWQQIIDVNLTGAFLTTHYSLPLLADNAHLLYIGAVTERLRLPGFAPYVAAKSGLEAYAEALRKEERNRRVTVLRPGAVATPFWDKLPMRLPANAMTPHRVAERVLALYNDGTTGTVDLTA
jgi:NAD(P)-dependent dehydrogenase (short-subunit alcohol dehydrogenase family)